MPSKKEPKIQWKSSKEWRIDLFRLEIAHRLTDVTNWQKHLPTIVRQAHKHFYRTTDRKGTPVFRSTINAGHFHDISLRVKPDGSFDTDCGPPLYSTVEIKHERAVSKTKKRTFFDKRTEETTEDDHRHKIVYEHSEMFSEANVRQRAIDDVENYRKNYYTPPPQPDVKPPENKPDEGASDGKDADRTDL